MATDRTQLTAAIKTAMPRLSQTTIDGLTDDQLAELVNNLPPGVAISASSKESSKATQG